MNQLQQLPIKYRVTLTLNILEEINQKDKLIDYTLQQINKISKRTPSDMLSKHRVMLLRFGANVAKNCAARLNLPFMCISKISTYLYGLHQAILLHYFIQLKKAKAAEKETAEIGE